MSENIEKLLLAAFTKGGPGSGCHGDNCGRPSSGSSNKHKTSKEVVSLKTPISDSETHAMMTYKGVPDVNHSLRDGSKLSEQDSNQVKDMDKVFEKSSLNQDTTVYRLVQDAPFVSNAEEYVGKVVEDKGFMSTSTSKDQISDSIKEMKLEGAVLVISARKGDKAVDMEQFNKGFARGDNQNEVLFPRGTKLKFNSVVPSSIEGASVEIHAEVVSSESVTKNEIEVIKLDKELNESAMSGSSQMALAALGYELQVKAAPTDKPELSKSIKIGKADQAKQIVYCVALEPETVDAHDDIISSEDIEKAAHVYLANHRVVGYRHTDPAEAEVVESYIAPLDFDWEGQRVKKGSWVVAFHILSDELWKQVESGELNSVSIGGYGLRKPE